MRRIVLALAAVAAVALTSCQPVQLELDMTVRSRARLGTAANGQAVSLSGVLACSGGTVRGDGSASANSEPLDIWLTVRQGAKVARGDASDISPSLHCVLDPILWEASWSLVGHPLTTGAAAVELEVCTNPSEEIDEFCEVITRSVTLS